jgi:hypothetical protein
VYVCFTLTDGDLLCLAHRGDRIYVFMPRVYINTLAYSLSSERDSNTKHGGAVTNSKALHCRRASDQSAVEMLLRGENSAKSLFLFKQTENNRHNKTMVMFN